MPLWLVLTIFSVLAVALAEISQKVTLTNKVNISSITNNFYLWLSISVMAAITCLIFGFKLPSDFQLSMPIILKFLINGICYFAAGSLYYQSFKGNSVSLSVILCSITSVITMIVGIVFFNESMALLKFIGGALILVAIFIVNYTKKQKFDKYNVFALTGGILYGISYSIDKNIVGSMNPIIYQAIICFLVAFFSLVFKPKLIVKESKLINKVAIKSMFGAAVLFYLYQVCLFNAYKYGGEVGKISFISNTSIFIVFISEMLILKNTSDIFRKILGSVIVFIGATFIVLAK